MVAVTSSVIEVEVSCGLPDEIDLVVPRKPGPERSSQRYEADGAMTDPHRLSAAQAASLISAGRLTSEELVRSCLDRIGERDGAVGAWEFLDPDLALRAARQRDGERPRGPLHGVPIGIKDIVDTADLPTACGSPIYAGRRPADDAACVRRLRDAGAVIIGKTVTTEFALFRPGRTVNPHDPARTPGGSSSGTAAAVADYHVPVALGSQTAGSIVRPASFCGVFGLKPTYGSFELSGVKMISSSLDTLGHLARAAEDLAVVAQVLSARGPAGFDLGATSLNGRTPRIGFVRMPEWGRIDPDARDRIERAVDRLASQTFVDEIAAPAGFENLAEAQITIMECEAPRGLEEEWRRHPDQLSEGLRALLERGNARPPETYRDAQRVAGECRGRIGELFRDVDVVLAPSVLGEAPAGLDTTGDPLLCRAWTLLGTPAVAVPGLLGADGLPLGVQVVAPPGEDATALAAARWLAPRLAGEG
ncbi:MAG: amidase [Streptosporangiales bacterium]|nr:amidase [Streptosporangiales bacterium]